MAGGDIKTASKDERREYSRKHAEALAIIFRTDPGICFVISAMPATKRDNFLRPYMGALMNACRLNKAVFQQVNGWSTVAVFVPPGSKIDNPWTLLPAGLATISLRLGLGGIKKMLWDFQFHMDALKKKYMLQKGIKNYWYLFFIGTLAESRNQGTGARVIREWQQNVAAKENLPIWLEASTADSRRLYERCGFETLDVFVMGKGTHSASGEEEKGGEGVQIWPMLWMPQAQEKTANGV